MEKIKILSLSFLMAVEAFSYAQAQSTTTAGNPSARPVPMEDMLFKKTVWRTVDLREKQNRPFFADNQQITKIIIEAVRRGDLPIYKNDSLTSTLTQQEFTANLTMVQEGPVLDPIEQEFATDSDADWGAEAPPAASAAMGPAEFFPKDLYQLEIKEDAIFDKKRSRMVHDIQAITLVVPATLSSNIRLRDIPVGTFKYSDLARVFKEHPAEALWINPNNDAEHKNLADAFDLRLFSSFITKVSNPENASLEDIHGSGQQGILAASHAANELIEFEYNLWSF